MCEHDAADAYKISDGNDDDDDYMTVGQIPEIGKQGGLLASDMQSNGQEPRIILSVMDDWFYVRRHMGARLEEDHPQQTYYMPCSFL